MTITRFDEAEMIHAAQRAIGRIDARGRRGAEECPVEEIEAMAGLLACLGFAPLPYDAPPSLYAHEDRLGTTVRGALARAREELSRQEKKP